MTKYLSMNGTSDNLLTPTVTYDEIIIDYKSYQSGSGFKYHIDARTATSGGLYLYSSNGVETFGGSTYTAYVNETQVSSGQDSIPTDQRLILKVNFSSTTSPITLFSRYTNIQFIQVDVFDVKILLNGVVQAHYDMSTGTVSDQSGNGNNATLNGGTWADDGAGGTPTGTVYTSSLNDSISFTDSFTKKFSSYKSLSDVLPFTDSITKEYLSFKSLSDTISTTDTINKSIIAIVTDLISTSESSDKDESYSFDDNISSQDAFTKSTKLHQRLSDSLLFNDSITTYKGKAINLHDSISIVDTISKSLYKHINDTVSTGDDEQRLTDKTLSDAINSLDIITTNEGKAILLADSVGLSDAISKAISQVKIDEINTADTTTQNSHINLQLYDVIVTTDTINIHLPNAPTLLGTIQLQGKRELNIYLNGTRQLDLKLKGVVQ